MYESLYFDYIANIRSSLMLCPQTKVMVHARALCGASKSSPATVPSLITLCHSTFICKSHSQQVQSKLTNGLINHSVGGPLMTDERERTCVIKMLEEVEIAHSWPTAWISTALQNEWYAT